MPEGDSLIYVITISGKFSIFLMSTANYIERAIAGLKPDVALVASIFANQIHDYTPRLLKALNYPKVILPTHWDNFEKPLSEPPLDLRNIFGAPAGSSGRSTRRSRGPATPLASARRPPGSARGAPSA